MSTWAVPFGPVTPLIRDRFALLAHAAAHGLDPDDVCWLPLDELASDAPIGPEAARRRASAARRAHARAACWQMPRVVHGDREEPLAGSADGRAWHGVGAGARAIGAVVRFASLTAPPPVPAGAIVVARAITPALALLVDGCAALVSETGGLLDHGAALARELGIPCVVGCAGAWSALDDGARVLVDGDAGRVERLDGD